MYQHDPARAAATRIVIQSNRIARTPRSNTLEFRVTYQLTQPSSFANDTRNGQAINTKATVNSMSSAVLDTCSVVWRLRPSSPDRYNSDMPMARPAKQ